MRAQKRACLSCRLSFCQRGNGNVSSSPSQLLPKITTAMLKCWVHKLHQKKVFFSILNNLGLPIKNCISPALFPYLWLNLVQKTDYNSNCLFPIAASKTQVHLQPHPALTGNQPLNQYFLFQFQEFCSQRKSKKKKSYLIGEFHPEVQHATLNEFRKFFFLLVKSNHFKNHLKK